MGAETEVKLALTAEAAEKVPQLSALVDRPYKISQLRNIYFDTSDFRLNQARVALRLRQFEGGIVQTLKTKGRSINGLSRRGEWEWPRNELSLDMGLLTPDILPDSLKELEADQLNPLFRTDFVRQSWHVKWPQCDPVAEIEVALDRGEISAADKIDPICELELELELELLSGPEEALLDLVNVFLNAELGATPLDISKAERGLRLLGSVDVS